MKMHPFSKGALCALLLLASCKKDQPEVTSPPAVPTPPGPSPSSYKVYIVNEGSFNAGNASVSWYDPQSGTVDPDRFGSRNNSAKLGDVAQSMIRHGNEYFIVVNNSGKIVVCDTGMKKTGEIAGLQSPRYIQPVGGNLAYVSDFKSNALTVVDLGARSIVQTISLPGFTEGMVRRNDKVYVCNSSRSYLYSISTTTHKVIDSISVGVGASSLVLDKNDKLWVLASGDWAGTSPARLTRINPVSWTIEQALGFAATLFPSRLCMSSGKDSLFYLMNGVYCMPVTAQQLPASPMIVANGANFYGLGVSPRTRRIYVSDAIDYMQKSTVLVHDAKGVKLTEFKAGINATDFYFE